MMSNGLNYTSADVFKAAEMDTNGFYIVVEGDCDKPIFSELLSQLKDYGFQFDKPIIGSGGGKPNILCWLQEKPNVSVKVVLDRDFDDPNIDLLDKRIVPLEVYSIENYYFSVDVLAPLFASLSNSTIDEVSQWLSLDELTKNWEEELSELIAVLFYYQKNYMQEKKGWGETDIVQNRDNWGICSNKVNKLTTQLTSEMGVTIQRCLTYFNQSHLKGECLSICFPGKLIKKSFFRYLKFHCSQNGGDFSSLTNVDHLMQSLTSRLMKNCGVKSVLENLTATP